MFCIKVFNVLWGNKEKDRPLQRTKMNILWFLPLMRAGRLLTFRYNNYVIWMKVPGGRRKKKQRTPPVTLKDFCYIISLQNIQFQIERALSQPFLFMTIKAVDTTYTGNGQILKFHLRLMINLKIKQNDT